MNLSIRFIYYKKICLLLAAMLFWCNVLLAQNHSHTRADFGESSASIDMHANNNAKQLLDEAYLPHEPELAVENDTEATPTATPNQLKHSSLNNKLSLNDLLIGRFTKKPLYMALKTNMLMDAVAIPNIGLEVYIGKNWSLAANWHYAWWKTDSEHWYWRTYGGDIGLRKWFGAKAAQKPLTGHHIGVYGQLLTYDIATGGRGYLGDKWSYGAGVAYGYSLPIAKRLNIDFTLGVGYLGGEYEEYLPIDHCYVWQATKDRHWVGPTKAEISIVWLLGRSNTNKTKGAKR